MNFVADEGVDRQVVDRLRADGHTVWWTAEMAPGISDDEVLDHCNREASLLLTADKDFGELVYRLGRVVRGVVLVRLSGVSTPLKAEIVSSALAKRGEQLSGSFPVISPGQIRIRKRI